MIRFNTCHLLQAKVCHWKECESALQRLRGKHVDVYQEAAEIRVYNKFLFALCLSRGKHADVYQGCRFIIYNFNF